MKTASIRRPHSRAACCASSVLRRRFGHNTVAWQVRVGIGGQSGRRNAGRQRKSIEKSIPNSIRPEDIPSARFDPTSAYQVQHIEGWEVLVDSTQAQASRSCMSETMTEVRHQFYDITRKVQPAAVDKLRKTGCRSTRRPHQKYMAYGEGGSSPAWLKKRNMNPEIASCVELFNARTFVKWTLEQPWMVIHEFAHGYPINFSTPGSTTRTCWLHAKRRWTRSCRLGAARGFRDGKTYATTNHMEYFAEVSEACFGANDFYPFVNVELRQRDPVATRCLRNFGARICRFVSGQSVCGLLVGGLTQVDRRQRACRDALLGSCRLPRPVLQRRRFLRSRGMSPRRRLPSLTCDVNTWSTRWGSIRLARGCSGSCTAQSAGERQSAYQVLVAGSPEKLAADRASCGIPDEFSPISQFKSVRGPTADERPALLLESARVGCRRPRFPLEPAGPLVDGVAECRRLAGSMDRGAGVGPS